MAYASGELFKTGTGPGATLRAMSTLQVERSFAAGSGVLAALTPVALNTSTHFWVPFASGGANGTGTIGGFVWPDAITLDAANQVLGCVMFRGEIHIDDIPIISGYTLAQLKTAINASSLRTKGLIIRGIVPVLGTDDNQV